MKLSVHETVIRKAKPLICGEPRLEAPLFQWANPNPSSVEEADVAISAVEVLSGGGAEVDGAENTDATVS